MILPFRDIWQDNTTGKRIAIRRNLFFFTYVDVSGDFWQF